MPPSLPVPHASRLKRRLSWICLAVALPLSGCTKFDLLNAAIPSSGYQLTSVPYGPLPRQQLDVYRPRDAVRGAPIVVFFYGGSWQRGQKSDYLFVAQALASRGFVAVLPDYRLYPDVTFPAFIEDGALAIRWVHDNAAQFGADAGHLYLMGHSAGAHIAALLTLDGHYLKDVGLDRSAIRAAAVLSGPYDFMPAPDDLRVFGMSPRDRPDPRIEPIRFVDGREPPMLLVTGLKDDVVDPQNTFRLAARIRRFGGDVRCITYPARGHPEIVMGFALPFRWLVPVLRDVTAYFRAH